MSNKEEKDIKTIELLELLDRYQLIKSSNRNNFIDGFLNLSRANFQNDKIRYGIEKFDLRCYQACKIINLSSNNIDQFQLIDRLEKNRLIKKSKEQEEQQQQKDNEQEEQQQQQKDKEQKESILRNRKEKKINEINELDDNDEKPIIEYKDPIKQFGGIVPQELRKSQINFNNALIELIEIINLIKKIEILINELNLN